MPYVAGHIGRGQKVFNAFASDPPAAKRRRLEAAEDIALASGNPEAAGLIDELGDLFYGEDGQDQVVPDSVQLTAVPRSRAFSRVRYRGSRGSSMSARKIKRVLLNMIETKQHNELTNALAVASGDATTPVIYISNPISNIGQGTEGQDVVGQELFLRGIRINGRVTNDETTDVHFRIWVIKSPIFADLPGGFTQYNSTTTASTNPTQTATEFEFNIPQFDSAATNGQFVGATGGRDIVDPDLAKVIFSREIHLRSQYNPTETFKFWVPINRMWSHTTISGVAPADQLRNFARGNYYICMKLIGTSAVQDIATTVTATVDLEATVFFKDP